MSIASLGREDDQNVEKVKIFDRGSPPCSSPELSLSSDVAVNAEVSGWKMIPLLSLPLSSGSQPWTDTKGMVEQWVDTAWEEEDEEEKEEEEEEEEEEEKEE
ncbi:hypothetical protein HGM15179_001787 [Zosterops borbonicus]|uniref:Uncharacterized protein n=1 Tax=Zosterops borbonicus TaxID=364589 RepID=A0A8K1GTV9_9PASS|nr:hypothetical protein HGM15179_001787 [Zosterops borbonicus]